MPIDKTFLPTICRLGAICIALGLIWPTTTLANETLRYSLATGSDDAEEGNDGLEVVDLASSDLEITTDDDVAQVIGLRFTGLDIPPEMPILAAYIQFTTDEDDKDQDPFSVTIQAQAADNAPTFTETTGDISSRPRTAASVLWENIQGWTVEHEAGPAQRTPDLAAVLQEVVNRPGWQAGNAMALIMDGVGTRSAESFEGSDDHVQLPDLAAHLVVTLPSRAVYRIAGSFDDAEEGDEELGSMDIDSSDLELTEDHTDWPQTIGLRFTGVSIPVGAEILSAHIQFAVDELDNEPGSLTFYGEADANPAVYRDEAFNISSRPKTTASVAWNEIPAWTVEGEAGLAQRSPDVSAIVREIVGREDWAEGHALAFIIEGDGLRIAESFDGDANLAPALHVTYIGERETAASDKIRLSWGSHDDPATTMTVIWDQTDNAEAQVLYDHYDPSEGCLTDPATYAHEQAPTRITPYRGMNNYFAQLTGLAPDSDYRFVIASGNKVSDCAWFRTAPDVPKPITFISGGDTKSAGEALMVGRWSNEMVAKLRPLFVIFTGDFNTGEGTSDPNWQQWLTDWAALTPSSDGRLYPIIAVHGNHEDGDFEVLYNLFDAGNTDPAQPADYDYYGLSIGGNLLRVISLNSQFFLNAMPTEHELQTAWLAQELAAHQDHSFKIASYHKPIRPHTLSKAENDHELVWADLFDQYGLDIAFESDTHNHAITFPLRRSDGPDNVMGFVRDDQDGVLYVGEGSWGATPRLNNDDKVWTLDSDAMNQLKWHFVYPPEGNQPARWELRTVVTARYVDGELVNFVEGVAELSEDDLFTEPAGIALHEAPFYGPVIRLPFQTIEGDAPQAPFNLTGMATGYTEVTIHWTNGTDPGQVSGIEIERQIGGSDGWLLIANGLPSDTTRYIEGNLDDGMDYNYRVRAVSIFGPSPWSAPVTVSTPVDERLSVQFQQGQNGYTGTQIAAVASGNSARPFVGADFGHALSIDQETGDYGVTGSSHGLIRFPHLFDANANAIPPGAAIEGATLRFYTVSDTNGPVGLHRLSIPWDPATATWDGLVDGVQTDDTEANALPDDSHAPISGGEFVVFDVSDSVRAWAAGEPNNGWAIINQSTDGWDFLTEGYSGDDFARRRPLLTVFYSLGTEEPGDGGNDGTDSGGEGNGDIDGNGVVDQADVQALRRHLYPYTGGDCPRCDVDGDGRITMQDMRRLMDLLR